MMPIIHSSPCNQITRDRGHWLTPFTGCDHEGKLNVATRIRWNLIGLLLIVALLAACTRRPDAEPVVQLEAVTPAAAVTTSAQEGDTGAVTESTAGEPDAQPAASTATPNAAAVTPAATEEGAGDETPLRPDQTFQYTVEDGDSLSYLAEKFGTDMQTLRELNFLLDDNILVGSILVVPYVEGISADGVPTPLPGPFEYTVQQGDTLGDLAYRFNVNALSIVEANQLLTPDNLIVGTTLLIPGYTPDTSAPSDAAGDSGATSGDNFVRYVVQPADTFFSIAQDFGVDPDELAAANNIVNRNQLRIGQELVIPGVTQRDALILRGQTHIVASGETLSQIAQQYGVSMESILSINNLADADSIVVGQELIIPGE